MYDRFKVQFFGSNYGETFLKVKPHLVAKHTSCARSRSVALVGTCINYMLKQVEILLHRRKLKCYKQF